MKEAKREAKNGKAGRRITARCWMAEDFPMSLKQLVPVLDVVGYANKHVARVGPHYHPDSAQFTHPLALSSKVETAGKGHYIWYRCGVQLESHIQFIKCDVHPSMNWLVILCVYKYVAQSYFTYVAV